MLSQKKLDIKLMESIKELKPTESPTFPYTTTSDGFFFVYIQPINANLAYAYYTVTDNGATRTIGVSAYGGAGNSLCYPIRKGEIITAGATSNVSGTNTFVRFTPID